MSPFKSFPGTHALVWGKTLFGLRVRDLRFDSNENFLAYLG